MLSATRTEIRSDTTGQVSPEAQPPARYSRQPGSFRSVEREGRVVAGSMGVRGLISEVRGRTHEETVQLLGEGVQSLRADGVRRAHILVDPADRLAQAAEEVGFRHCPGETLLSRELGNLPEPARGVLQTLSVRDGDAEDLARIGLTLSKVSALEFKGWELLLIRQELRRTDRFFKVLEVNGDIVGASIGGAFGEQGTISHTWVAPSSRNQGFGEALSTASLEALYAAGARNVYLMTTSGNDRATRFWQRQGFQESADVSFMEIDL